ncbi:hypothetical protein ACSMXN_18285 [Jatrophihabitans sp. DSM 45814]
MSAARLRTVTISDSVTELLAGVSASVLITGSHAGRFSGVAALRAGVEGLIAHDAAIGLAAAGLDSLALLERHRIPAATIDHRSARIGDGLDCAEHGVISYVNATAAGIGVQAGMAVTVAADLMARASVALPRVEQQVSGREASEQRTTGSEPIGRPVEVALSGSRRAVWLLDSASMARPELHAGAVVVTGSHGSLLGGRPETALKAAVFAAVFNDAGCEPSRLPVLDARGIAAVTAAASTARIGDASSSLFDGRISVFNEAAARLGATVGAPVRAFVENAARTIA